MAKRFVDCSEVTELGSITNQDGSALTLTNTTGVRVLFDDTATPAQVLVALERAKLRITDILS